ncbi:MAG: hypothetical protein R2715_12350 [Ilumatobacteraceae bacterium]
MQRIVVAAGFAERRPCEIDGRGVRVGLTAAGRAWHTELVTRRLSMMSSILETFSAEDQRALSTLLGRFVGALDHYVSELDHEPVDEGPAA